MYLTGNQQIRLLQAISSLATISLPMAEHDQLLENIGKLIEPLRAQLYEQGANLGRVVKSQQRVEKTQQEQAAAIQTLDEKVVVLHEFTKQAHAETMKELLHIGEINYHALKKELEALKKRIEQLETHERRYHSHHE